jgi:hypothetical protein
LIVFFAGHGHTAATAFAQRGFLIPADAERPGPGRERSRHGLRCRDRQGRAIATSAHTGGGRHIVPEIIDDLGYSPRQGDAITSVSSAIGKEPGYMLRVIRFTSLGFSFPNFNVHVHDLPDGVGIDGLLGLSFLRHFNYEVRSQEGRICIDRVAD